MSILEQYKLCLESASESATELPVANSDFILESSNELATGIQNGYEHSGTVQTFLMNY